jgi:hypothetical protein
MSICESQKPDRARAREAQGEGDHARWVHENKVVIVMIQQRKAVSDNF